MFICHVRYAAIKVQRIVPLVISYFRSGLVFSFQVTCEEVY